MLRKCWFCSLVGLMAFGALNVYAQRIVVESFDYSLGALNLCNGGSGWNGAWSESDADGDATVVSGLTFTDYPVFGNAAEIQMTDTSGIYKSTIAARYVGASIPTWADDLWVSFLYKQSGAPLEANVGRMAEIRCEDLTFRMRAKNSDSQGVALGYDSVTTANGSVSIQDGNTYMIIAKFEDVGDASGGSAKMWVLSESNYDTIKSGGVTETELDNNKVMSVIDSHSQQTFGTTDRILLMVYDNSGTDFTAIFDELKYATSLDDVALPTVSDVLNYYNCDFDPWTVSRWDSWYQDGDVVRTFDLNTSLTFASRTGAWEVGLSSLTGTKRLFTITNNSNYDIDGNSVTVDARKDYTRTWSTYYYYDSSNGVSTSIDFGEWVGFHIRQSGTTVTTGAKIHDITLQGFLNGISFDHGHQRIFTVDNCIFSTNVWGVFPRGANVSITNCSFTNNWLGGAYCEYNSHNYSFEDCIFTDNNIRGADSYADIVIDACYDYTISGNDFESPSYATCDYQPAISFYRNRGEGGDIREHHAREVTVYDNYIEGRNLAIDISARQGSNSLNDISDEARCYVSNNTIEANYFKNCTIGIKIASNSNIVDNNTFDNVELDMVLHCVFYSLAGNEICNQSGDTAWIWNVESDYSADYGDYIPYLNGLGDDIGVDEKFIHVISSTNPPLFIMP